MSTAFDNYVDQIHASADEYQRVMREWDEANAKVFMAMYLAFEEFGLVGPYYDTASTCATTEEEWDVFV